MTGHERQIDYEAIRGIVADVMELDRETALGLGGDEDLRNYDFGSLAAVELVVALEVAYPIVIEEEDLLIENLCTLDRIASLVRRLEEEQA
ncbi:acyl carrier protein [Paenibacillus sp. HB172176]|uniref:acyl carrier protein n=1 Tax=Paenibacillus sp. HB172176 TaxID=2493690 RepID=UPI00143C61E9|nr:acyl carrier protein [Paenibacillus sp. HB172176]